jgi:hypothetical protein
MHQGYIYTKGLLRGSCFDPGCSHEPSEALQQFSGHNVSVWGRDILCLEYYATSPKVAGSILDEGIGFSS